MSDNVIYSVRMRRGPDVVHYDLIVEEEGIRLRYLGEYWSHHRPRRGLQRSADLLLYSINKRKNRRRDSGYDIRLDYCEIRSITLHRPRLIRRRLRRAGRLETVEEAVNPRLVIVTRDGRRYELEAAAKVYELLKTLLKRTAKPRLERCGAAFEVA
ncbi:MAG: hypothetical protein GXO15_03885 [Crenarchaeota archaeon]|nr:hypothetical protein [Thermoproteota archaeon]